jgi:hypothetical protein
VVLHVVESTFSRGFESYLRSHSFNRLGFPTCCRLAVCKNQPRHLEGGTIGGGHCHDTCLETECMNKIVFISSTFHDLIEHRRAV